jgi:hypothetical protein
MKNLQKTIHQFKKLHCQASCKLANHGYGTLKNKKQDETIREMKKNRQAYRVFQRKIS